MILEKLITEKIATIGGKEYRLQQVNEKQLFQLRLSDKPSLVFKYGKQLWYTELPDEKIRFSAIERKQLSHRCSSEYECCKRLSADVDPIGCASVRDESFGKYRKSPQNRASRCKDCMRIEKYSFITYGIETFNMVEDNLKVISCKNCTRSKVTRVHVNVEEQKRKIVALAQHLNPNIKNFSELEEFSKIKF